MRNNEQGHHRFDTRQIAHFLKLFPTLIVQGLRRQLLTECHREHQELPGHQFVFHLPSDRHIRLVCDLVDLQVIHILN